MNNRNLLDVPGSGNSMCKGEVTSDGRSILLGCKVRGE